MKKEVLRVVVGTAILCALMCVVFLLIGRFDVKVVWGAVAGFVCASVNFMLLAFSVSKSVGKGDKAGVYMGSSYLFRLLLIAVIVVFSIKSPYCNYVATVIPLLFPRVIITVLQGIMKWKGTDKSKEADNLGGS